jgi:amino acid transporter
MIETACPAVNAVLGVTVMAGPAAVAVAAPREARPPKANAPIAILVIKRLIVYVLPIAVVTNLDTKVRVESVTSTCDGHCIAR